MVNSRLSVSPLLCYHPPLESGGGASEISRGPDTISFEIANEGGLDSAARQATDYCEETEKQAVLLRTEPVGKATLVYYECQ